jgi:hypothetical protein
VFLGYNSWHSRERDGGEGYGANLSANQHEPTLKHLPSFHRDALIHYLESIIRSLRYHTSLLECVEASVETVALLLTGANGIASAVERISQEKPEEKASVAGHA